MTRTGMRPIAVPCRIVSIVADRLLQVQTRSGSASVGEPFGDGRVQPRGRRAYDEMELAQVGRRQDVARKLEIRAREPTQMVVADGLSSDVGADRRFGDNRDVEFLMLEPAADNARIADEHRRLDAGIAQLEPTQEVRQADQREALVQAEAQHALQRIARLEALDHFAGRAEEAVRVFDQRVTLRRKADAWSTADEQRDF